MRMKVGRCSLKNLKNLWAGSSSFIKIPTENLLFISFLFKTVDNKKTFSLSITMKVDPMSGLVIISKVLLDIMRSYPFMSSEL